MAGKIFGKRPPRLPQIFHLEINPVYFVTFCTYKRRQWLACESVHEAFIVFAQNAWRDFYIATGRYVIMPDHVHLFVTGGADFLLGRWIGQLKRALYKAAFDGEKTDRPWQDGFFDHMLRSDESMAQKWDYIRQNPVRARLATNCEEWPYQGEMVSIDRA